MDDAYLSNLMDDSTWLPGPDNLLAAFRRDQRHCRYLLFGESPYPRPQSANGIAFYDAAVNEIWSPTGLSKAVNRATSLRNIIKTALVAEDMVAAQADGKIPQVLIAELDKTGLIQTLPEFFANLEARGFLMLNATPVLHLSRNVSSESHQWKPFINALLESIKQEFGQLPTLVLWGNIAKQIDALPGSQCYPRIACEHPYNVSFIHNPLMQTLFSELKILQPAD